MKCKSEQSVNMSIRDNFLINNTYFCSACETVVTGKERGGGGKAGRYLSSRSTCTVLAY